MPLTQRKPTSATPLNGSDKVPRRASPLSITLPSPSSLKSVFRTKKEREHAVVIVGFSILVFWIFLMGGFSFGGPLSTTIRKRKGIQRLAGLGNTPAIPVGHVLSVTDDTRQLAAFSIEILSSKKGVKILNETHAVVSSPGPHMVHVALMGRSDRKLFKNSNKRLLQPPVLRLVGDVIVPIPLSTAGRKGYWSGTFVLPQIDAATLTLESQWTGAACATTQRGSCGLHYSKPTILQTQVAKDWDTILRKEQASASEIGLLPTWDNSATLFPPTQRQAWVHVNRIPNYPSNNKGDRIIDDPAQQHYVWGDPVTLLNEGTKWTTANTRQLTTEPDTYLAFASTILRDDNNNSNNNHDGKQWYDSFAGLSNYEIVCWMGGESSQLLQAVFLSMRPNLFANQRPFKFHYHPMTSLETPDATWNDDLKEKFRKCKHVFVSLEEPVFMESSIGEPLSAKEFQQRVLTFTNHLITAFPDPTFPIWMVLTDNNNNASPLHARYQANHCYNMDGNSKNKTALQQQTSLDHPCHVVLRDMFTAPTKAQLFAAADQDRIRLLDNTDISRAGIESNNMINGQHPRSLDILAIVALRLYVVIGKQVKEWRDHGQIGKVDGLHRNGTIVSTEKNLVHYSWKK